MQVENKNKIKITNNGRNWSIGRGCTTFIVTKRSGKQQITLIHHLIKSIDTGTTPDVLNLA